MDKSIEIKKREVDKGIIVDDKEGFIARNSAFIEFLPDKFFGFKKSAFVKDFVKNCTLNILGTTKCLEQ